MKRDSSRPSGPSEADLERMRAVLERAVARACPPWLASRRDDLVQNALMRMLEILERDEESVRAETSYLWRVGFSAVMDEIRRVKRRAETPLELVRDASSPDAIASVGATSSELHPARWSESQEIREAVRSGLRELADDRRRAVMLYLQGFTLKQTANILGCSEKAADNQRYRGLRALREFLSNRGFGFESSGGSDE